MSKFHQSKEWRKASKAHKTPVCYYCGKATELQTDHVLPVSKWPMMRLWTINFVLACQSCNVAKSDKLKLNLKTIKLLGIYGMIKLLINGTLMIYFAFSLTLVYKDITAGGIDSSFSGQILINTYEKSVELLEELTRENAP